MSTVAIAGVNVALNPITRDGGTLEQMQIVNLGDTTSGAAVSVTPAGTTGTNALGVQGVTNGVPIPVSGSFTATTTFPLAGNADAQAPAAGQAVALAGWNGASFDRLQTTSAGSGVLKTSQTGPLPAGTNAIGSVNAGTGFPSTTAPGTSGAQAITVQGSASGVPIPVSGSLTSAPLTSSTATLSSLAATTSSASLLPANAARKQLAIDNLSSSPMYVLCGTGAAGNLSAPSYSFRIPAQSSFVLPILFLGALQAVWDDANGAAYVTEFT